MALFGGQKDAKFLASINSELLNSVVDTEIELFKLNIEFSDSNLYGESENKSYYDSILIPCLIDKQGKTASQDDYGHTYTRTAKFSISRDILVKADIYPEVGDIILWDNEYYELDNVDANQYFVGKNPDYPNEQNPLNPGLANYGNNLSTICITNIVPADRVGITKERYNQ
jgi:hypothetical protein